MTDHDLRPYADADHAACLAVFDSNTPKFFARSERNEFAGFLQDLLINCARYLVLTRHGRIIACGGLEPGPSPDTAALAWGMVARPHHGQGLGHHLTCARLALARATPRLTQLTLATSQHTSGFYARYGFAITRITPDGFGPALDRVDMTLPLGHSSP
jgi:predicted GNAT family N-acyltransferase